MARPIPETLECDLRKISKKEELKPYDSKSIVNVTDRISSSTLPVKPIAPVAPVEHEQPLPPEPIPPKPPELFKPEAFKPEPFQQEDPHVFEKPGFIPQKPIPHSPKISPSSIPNPNPSVTTTKHVEPGYPNYGGYLYSIPGYSAFQPVNHSGMPGYHPGLVQQNQPLQPEPPTPTPEFPPFTQPNPSLPAMEDPNQEEDSRDTDALLMVTDDEGTQNTPSQTDFEEHFTPEIISTVPNVSSPEVVQSQPTESKMNITSLAQGSGATVTIPSLLPSKEIKKKPERFSLKTSIPISKIDMKCVSNPPDSLFQNSIAKKSFNPTFNKDLPRVEIQSNIVIKSATKEPEHKDIVKPALAPPSNNINTAINAAETINKTETQFRIPDVPKSEQPTEVKNTPSVTKPLFNPMNIETSKANFIKPTDRDTFTSDPKNQILFIQNKSSNNQNQKMLLTLQQQNPQVLLQRTNFESKNLQAPSRLSNQNKKCKDDVSNDGTSSKVVALKRLHQENCDENDFENLITENQIYGNKIVVKEKSQGTQQEQDLKNKKTVTEKVNTTDSKNVVLQPNFLYLSNVQFPNMMIVKNNSKVTQTTDSNKTTVTPIESKFVNDSNAIVPTTEGNTVNTGNKNMKPPAPMITKEIHVLKSSNGTQTVSSKAKSDNNAVTSKSDMIITKPDIVITKPDSVVIGKPENIVLGKPESIVIAKSDISKPDIVITKPDLVIQASQKVIMNPQFVYQVPISSIVESDNANQHKLLNINAKDYPKFITPKKDYTKQFEQPKSNDKLYIACPYQMDSKLQPKIVITNLRPKVKVDEVSSLDIYEKRKRLRRLKYLSNRESNVNKSDSIGSPVSTQTVKKGDKNDFCNIITPERMKSEIYKEFASAKCKLEEEGSGSESDDSEELEVKQYKDIIEEYGDKQSENEKAKTEFLANFKLASQETYKEKDLELQDRMLKHDKVRSAYAAIGRLDVLLKGPETDTTSQQTPEAVQTCGNKAAEENLTALRKKTLFLSRLKLTQVTQKYKEGYEKAWEVILKERERRNAGTKACSAGNKKSRMTSWPSFCLETKGQLEMISEIKQSVSENNNLIKKMLDTVREKLSNEESISSLAEKNFSELSRLSKMADRSVQLVSGQNTRKRDLNPGFDSENIQNQSLQDEQPFQNCAKLKIPSISHIISLKSTEECLNNTTTPATSMDEPLSSAAGVTNMIEVLETTPVIITTYAEAACQADDNTWPGMDSIIKSYKEYETGRRREIADLHRRNTALRVEGAHITRSASRDSDRARALLAERQNLAIEETRLRLSLQRLRAAIEQVKNWTGQHDFC